jgi:hypothetical protein
MVNFLLCPEMRQYDRSGLIGEGLGRGEKSLEFKLFGIGHGKALRPFCLGSQGFPAFDLGTRRAGTVLVTDMH